jgi:hypothetical protein
VDHPLYCEKYSNEFNNLWLKFEKNEIHKKETEAAIKIQKVHRANLAKKES